jgi:hypothetical protein
VFLRAKNNVSKIPRQLFLAQEHITMGSRITGIRELTIFCSQIYDCEKCNIRKIYIRD